ncbi:MAG TPA: FapA family protein [Desulfomonilia bacterium]|nr:FapA family protein [Desulfomonilia bacterium]
MEKDYRIEFYIAEGGLAGSMKIVPLQGDIQDLRMEDLVEAVQNEGITFGVLTDAIEKMAREKTVNQWVVIARGNKQEEGRNGYIKFHFDKDRTRAKIKEDATGKVNLRDLNLIQNVKKGDILCEAIAPQAGNSGTTVRNEEIPSKEGSHEKLPSGTNVTYSGDRSQMFATIDGMVRWAENTVIVDPVYTVHDVDASVGNIRFNGSVVVQGEVGDGYEIHAEEDITIATTVGRVVLEAGGNIRIAGGVLGQEKAIITANGSIHARFIQDAHVKSEKDIVVNDYIRNSLVSAIGPVVIRNENGFIATSKVSSECWIYCNTVGQEDAGVETELSIGHSPVLHQEQGRIKEEILDKTQDFLKLQSSLAKLRVMKSTSELSRQQEMLYEKILDTTETLRKSLIQKNAKIMEITEKIQRTYQGNIYVEGTIHDRTNLRIGMASRTITGAMSRVHFFLKEAQIADAEFVLVPDVKKVLEARE